MPNLVHLKQRRENLIVINVFLFKKRKPPAILHCYLSPQQHPFTAQQYIVRNKRLLDK